MRRETVRSSLDSPTSRDAGRSPVDGEASPPSDNAPPRHFYRIIRPAAWAGLVAAGLLGWALIAAAASHIH